MVSSPAWGRAGGRGGGGRRAGGAAVRGRGGRTEVDECSAQDGGGAAGVEAADAGLRLDLREGVEEAGVAWLVELARRDQPPVALHAHLDQVARHGDGLADAARSHARRHLGEEGRLLLGLIAAEEGADVLVPDRAEARVRDVARDGGSHARIQAADALVLHDVAHHANEAVLGAHKVRLALQLQARLRDVDRDCATAGAESELQSCLPRRRRAQVQLAPRAARRRIRRGARGRARAAGCGRGGARMRGAARTGRALRHHRRRAGQAEFRRDCREALGLAARHGL